jgi:hypothetical protein
VSGPTPDEIGLIARAFEGSGVDMSKTKATRGGLPEDVIRIEPKTLMCPTHGEYLRAQWPKGFAVVGLQVSAAALESEELLAAAGWEEGQGPPAVGINRVTETRPLCCFVGEDVLRRAYRESGVLEVRKCRVCKRRGEGGAYRDDAHPEPYFLCMECMLLGGRRAHAAAPQGGVWTS